MNRRTQDEKIKETENPILTRIKEKYPQRSFEIVDVDYGNVLTQRKLMMDGIDLGKFIHPEMLEMYLPKNHQLNVNDVIFDAFCDAIDRQIGVETLTSIFNETS